MEGTLAEHNPQAAFSTATESSAASPLDAFTGNITRPRVSPLYRLGLAVVAFAMVLLPAVYIVLVALVALGVLYHLTHDLWILGEGSGGFLVKLLVYFGPAVAGGILVFFMLKPLFAKRASRNELPSLDPAKEALLFAFVQRICEQVGAPMPCRIDVDCQVNAFASLRRGFWSRDLVLTIGLPLAGGLDMREFAGVLAHEFGHFAQGAGMRLTYVIRQINFWFARVVFERDQWDFKLERAAKRTDFRIAVVLHIARGCVWLTRRILWLLMRAGHGISCFMLRQMEYDADTYECKVAGSDAFESTMARLPELNAASQMAFEEVRQSWASHRLPENLPLLIHHKTSTLTPEIRQKIAAADSKKTGWFDTHPCHADRVQAARTLAEPGIFRVERPAAELFADFAGTSRIVTRFQYEKNWKLQFSEQNLVSSDETLRESAVNSEANAAIQHFYGLVNITLAPLLLGAELPPVLNRESALAQWRQAREQSLQLRADAEKASAECLKQQTRLVQTLSALTLSRANFKYEPKGFGLPEYAATVAAQETAAKMGFEEASETMRQQTQNLAPFLSALRTRVTLALQLTCPVPGTNDAAAMESKNLMKTLTAVGATLPKLHQMGVRLKPLLLLAQNRGNHPDPNKVGAHMTRIAGELRGFLSEVQAPLNGLNYPFPHPRGQLSLIQYASYEKSWQNEWEAAYQEGSSHVERLFALHLRLLGRLLVMTQQAEKELERSEPANAGQAKNS